MAFTDIDFYYFSGTGNTLLVVKRMAEVFRENGITVNLHPIEKSDPSGVDLSHALGLAFPVAAQSTYRFVWDFIEGLPEAGGTEVFMVDTLAAFSGAIVGPLKKFLERVGYKTVGAKEIKMPGNFYPPKVDAEADEEKRAKGLLEAEQYAGDLMDGTARWKSQGFFADLFSSICRGNFTWSMMARAGKKFQVDRGKCQKCGICAKLCPVGNITNDEYPRFGEKCQQCMRCISFCPVEAISVPGKKYQLYRAVKAGEIMKG